MTLINLRNAPSDDTISTARRTPSNPTDLGDTGADIRSSVLGLSKRRDGSMSHDCNSAPLASIRWAGTSIRSGVIHHWPLVNLAEIRIPPRFQISQAQSLGGQNVAVDYEGERGHTR